MMKPTWPLGTKFTDSKGRRFEVVKTVFGDPDAPLQCIVECQYGWAIQYQIGDHPQTLVGFKELGQENIITESVTKMDEYVQNGHLKWI